MCTDLPVKAHLQICTLRVRKLGLHVISTFGGQTLDLRSGLGLLMMLEAHVFKLGEKAWVPMQWERFGTR